MANYAIFSDFVESGSPIHIGIIYEMVMSDIIKKYFINNQHLCKYIYGLDENTCAIPRDGAVEEHLFEYRNKMQSLLDVLAPHNTITVKTYSSEHIAAVKDAYMLLKEHHDLYVGEYRGDYDPLTGSFISQRIRKKNPVETITHSETAVFFDTTKYSDAIITALNVIHVFPESRKIELRNSIREGLKDFCITRNSNVQGILCDGSRLYSWFDALIGYIQPTDLHFANDKTTNIHVCGPTTLLPHLINYPGLLEALDQPLPKDILFHGYFQTKFNTTFDSILKTDSADYLRLYLFYKKNPFNNSTFTEDEYVAFKRLVHNKFAPLKKYFAQPVVKLSKEEYVTHVVQYDNAMNHYRLDKAVDEIFNISKQLRVLAHSNNWDNSYKTTLFNALDYMLTPFVTDQKNSITMLMTGSTL
ncbi:MAG: class I tRNA ligase family protein [Candidatus Woesearchaeota archaeon]